MAFRFFTNMVSQATRGIATGIFIVGMLLIGFGIVIIAFPQIFALLAAAVFFATGLGLLVTAGKIFFMQRQFNKKMPPDDSEGYRKNVRIHTKNDD